MRILKTAGRILAWIGVAAILALMTVMVIVPLVMAWTPLTVLSGSMKPTIPTGSQVVVKHIEGQDDAAELAKGDIVTFLSNPDDQTLVTHRVVEIAVKADNRRVFTTKGDNNNAVDPDTITAIQLRGEVQYHVPYAGYLSNLLNAQQKAIGVVVVAVALFAYAVCQVIAAIRTGRSHTSAQSGRRRAQR